MSPTPRPGLARICLVLVVLVGTQNDPLMAVGHAATPPNVQTHHRQPLCGCSVPRLPHFGPLGVKLAHILPQSVFAGTEWRSGPIRPLGDRFSSCLLWNIHWVVAYNVSAHFGAARRALTASGVHTCLVCPGNRHYFSAPMGGGPKATIARSKHYETWSSDVQIWTALFCIQTAMSMQTALDARTALSKNVPL